MSNLAQEIERRIMERTGKRISAETGKVSRAASSDPRHNNERTPPDGSVTPFKLDRAYAPFSHGNHHSHNPHRHQDSGGGNTSFENA